MGDKCKLCGSPHTLTEMNGGAGQPAFHLCSECMAHIGATLIEKVLSELERLRDRISEIECGD